MKNLRLCLLGLVIGLTVPGCAATGDIIQADYVQADRATYDAVSGEYLDYVGADQSIDSDERKRRERTVTTWRLRLEQAEKPVEVAPITSGQ
jgi:hypothetical protein